MIGSSTFRHFSHTYNSGAGTEDVNITARVRNLENLLWVTTETANIGNQGAFNLSCGSSCGVNRGSYNVFVGAVRYPSNQVEWNNISNTGETYQELRKCFGALGSINHGGLLNACTYLSSETGLRTRTGGIPAYSPMGISFRSWRHELEDGVDTLSSALPIRLALNLNPPAAGVGVPKTADIYAQAIVLF